MKFLHGSMKPPLLDIRAMNSALAKEAMFAETVKYMDNSKSKE